MIFERVVIKNLFSYHGEQEFAFGQPPPGKNLVLISGRTGYGKTNFIRSIKLLFSGANEERRTEVQAGRSLSRKQYLLGMGEEWLGIFNGPARSEGAEDFGISIRWKEDRGYVEVHRFWHLDGDATEEELLIKADFLDEEIRGDYAQDFLEQRLPRDYVAFFFFDSEQIQMLAEANRKIHIKQIERLLNISQIKTLDENIGSAIRKWTKDASTEKEKNQLIALERGRDQDSSQLSQNQQDRGDLQYQIEELDRLIEQDDRYLESLRAHNYQWQQSDMKKRVVALEEEISRRQIEIAETLPVDIPVLANTNLVFQATQELKKLVESESAIQIGVLEPFARDLPGDLFDKPPHSIPPLTKSQVKFYKNRLKALVNAYIPEQQTDSEALFDLEILEAKRLLESLENLERDDVLRAHRVQELKALCERKRELHETNNKLDDLSVLSEEEREDYLARKKNREARIEELGSLKEKLDHLTREAGRLQSSIRDKERQISEQEKIVALSEKARKKVDLARTLRAMFEEYKKQLKARRRCQLEEAINRNFGLLMTSHKLIDSIEVEDDFALVYRDTNKETVGMANISAGMKQLAATSLLWALKQVSEKTVPLVIDTPLARLDRQHQENLLVQYYPKAGGQVIVLPTDSELDAHKYGLIQKHVYCEYRLNNPEGNMTKPVKAKMYE